MMRKEAGMVAEKTKDAYSFGKYYSLREWKRIARFLFTEGYGARATEEILRSKYMRWASDSSYRMTLEKFKPYFERERASINRMLAAEMNLRPSN